HHDADRGESKSLRIHRRISRDKKSCSRRRLRSERTRARGGIASASELTVRARGSSGTGAQHLGSVETSELASQSRARLLLLFPPRERRILVAIDDHRAFLHARFATVLGEKRHDPF